MNEQNSELKQTITLHPSKTLVTSQGIKMEIFIKTCQESGSCGRCWQLS